VVVVVIVFEWAMYALWVYHNHMGISALYNPKLPKCALTCLGNLAADRGFWILDCQVVQFELATTTMIMSQAASKTIMSLL
jgi:hypothetical protein